MFTILATSFTVLPSSDGKMEEAYTRVQRIAKTQLEKFIESRESGATPDWTSSMAWQSGDGSESLRWTEWRRVGQPTLALTDCRLIFQGSQQHMWEVEHKVGLTAECVQVGTIYRRSAISDTAYPLRTLPPVLSALATESCRSGDLALPYTLTLLKAQDIDSFIRVYSE